MPVPLPVKPNHFLPEQFRLAHNLCFLNHDILVELLGAGERSDAFDVEFTLRDDVDAATYAQASDVLQWLTTSRPIEDLSEVVRRTVFQAVLSDMLHFFYEALEASRKGKLSVTYALLRKPLQEHLCLLELLANDPTTFASQLKADPAKLRSQKMGGVNPHCARIETALSRTQLLGHLDPLYLATLRYDKSAEDGFDGVCNRATHLFTDHEAIKTESLNVNFVSSNWPAKESQWRYLYSRLPMILYYVRRLAEYMFAPLRRTDPQYLVDMELRVAAGTILWITELAAPYKNEHHVKLGTAALADFARLRNLDGGRDPTMDDLRELFASTPTSI